MVSVKKVEQRTIQVIDKTEVIAALEILLSENELVHYKHNRIYFRLSEKTKQLRNTFYGFSTATLKLLFANVLFLGPNIFSSKVKNIQRQRYTVNT